MSRRILHHGPDPAASPTLIGDRAVAGCWFEWHRLGGCGAGELRLRDEFANRASLEPGDWISFESEPGLRWYLGRIESKEASFPAGLRLRLEGMGVELGEVFPGGFGSDVDGIPPQRFGATDRFSFDPDRDIESFDGLEEAVDLVRLLVDRYIVPQSHIASEASLIEDSERPAGLDSLKVRGEESVRALVKELAVRAGAASWGVDAAGTFFFLQRRTEPMLTLRIGRDVTSLDEFSDRELLFNRVLLTGDYVYDHRDASGDLARRVYRWRGNFVQPESRAAHGERRLRMWIPWIRTRSDSVAFLREFFRTYSQPARRYRATTGPIELPAFPWLGTVRLENANGVELFTGIADSIRVAFDRTPRFTLQIGPEDPRNLWPEPPHDERWELPDRRESLGGEVSLTSSIGFSWPGGKTSWEARSSSGSSGTSTGATGTSDVSDDSDGSDASDLSDESGSDEASSSWEDDSSSDFPNSDTETGMTSDTSDASDGSSDASDLSDDSDGESSDVSNGSDASDDSDDSATSTGASGGTSTGSSTGGSGGGSGGGPTTSQPGGSGPSDDASSDDASDDES